MKINKRPCVRACLPGYAVMLSQLVVLPVVSAATDIPVSLSVSAGHRMDNLNWSIAGNTINVLSELKWEGLAIAQLQLAGELQLKNDRRLRARLGSGTIVSGTNQDSDYNGNNRTQEYSRSNNKAGGDVFDASIGIGKTLRMRDMGAGRSVHVTPFVGLSLHQQNLTMTDGVQTISLARPHRPWDPFPAWPAAMTRNGWDRGWARRRGSKQNRVGP